MTTDGPPDVALVGSDEWTAAVCETLADADSELEPLETTLAGVLDGDGDCLVCDATAGEDRGVSVLESVAERRPDCPIVFVPREGDDRLAGAAVAAGANAYVPFDERESVLRERLEGALEQRARRLERRERERDLRRSEELHRVTLNHMTDTVLLTDDDGAFTYVCPNVHFIFGYSVEEVHELGTVDALLGTGLYDDSELAAEGVLTNLECTATDKAGREHDLLVNVREVSIQDGTTLVSCRDVTTRKQRERALTSLHDTARELLYAESSAEISHRIVEDAADVLDLPAATAYLFDAGRNELRPAAYTEAMVSLEGRPGTRWPGDGSVVATTFVNNEVRTFDDLRRWTDPVGGLRGAVVAPLGDHGVFVVGSGEPGSIDGVTSEVADLLAATAEAALDRVERESTLRERDRELKRQNRRLTDLEEINEIIRKIGQDVAKADTREEIERSVCDRLAGTDRFVLAWIGDEDGVEEASSGARTTAAPDGEVTPRAWAGDDRGYLDVLGVETGGTDPGERTLGTGEATIVETVAERLREAPWRSAALTRGFQSVVSVPLAAEEVHYGALTVYAERPAAFDETVRSVLRELGETIAWAIGSVERKNALMGGRVVSLTYETADAGDAFVRLARAADCAIDLEGGLQGVDAGVLAFATVSDGDPRRVVELADSIVAVEDAQLVSEGATGGLVRLTLSRPFVATRLIEHGAVVSGLSADREGATLTVDVPWSVDTNTVDDIVRSTYPDATLRSRREHGATPTTRDRLEDDVLSRLTDRQLEVVRTAYHAGFFETPRAATGTEVAASLGISPTAFSNHTRTAQRKLFSALFDEAPSPTVQ